MIDQLVEQKTFSLDALDDAIFRRMNDVDFPVADVLAGIDAALAAQPHLTHVLLLNPDAVLHPGAVAALAFVALVPIVGVGAWL